MKFKKLYILTLAFGGFLFFLSFSGGPGSSAASLQVTGAPGSTLLNVGQPGTCGNSGCHDDGAFDPTVTLELLDGSSAVTEYEPGKSYTLQIVNTPGNGTPARYGFQAVSLDGSDSQAGEWGDVGADNQTITIGTRTYAEQNVTSSTGMWELEWVAPAAGTGEVTIYAASNACNGNNTSGGDGTDAAELVLAEGPPNSTFDLSNEIASFDILPNPVDEQFTLEVNSLTTGNFTVNILNVNGNIVQSEKINLSNGLNREAFNVSDLASGLYILQLSGEGQMAAAQLLKK